MINLLRGEFYKLFRSKCLYICSIVVVVFVLLMYGLLVLVETAQERQVGNDSVGITISVDENMQEMVSVWDEMGLSTMVQSMFSGMGSVITAIFAAIFVFGEYAGGAIKNVVGKGYSRWTVFVAKYFSTVVGAVIIEIMILLAFLLCEILILGSNRLYPEILLELCGYAGIQFLLTAAMTGIVVMINQICRSLGAGIAVSVCMIMFSSFITTGMNALLMYLKIDIDVCDYWVLDLISNCPVTDIGSEFMIRAIVCGILWFVLALGLGGIYYRKADVK